MLIPVYPGIPFGMAARFTDFPSTMNIRSDTYGALITDILESLYCTGFRRIFLGNDHSGEYQRSDEEMMDIWAAGVDETCQLLDNAWIEF